MAATNENSQIGKLSDCYDELSEVCQPCAAEGKCIQAERLCVDCKEYLCKRCSTYHKTLTATRNHVLVTHDEAKKVKPAKTKSKCSYKCTLHKDKNLEYFCATHSYLGCSVCMTKDHTTCKCIDYIPKVAEDIKKLDDFKKFGKRLKTIETACKTSMNDMENNLKQLKLDERQLKEVLKDFRKKINNAFDKFEKELAAQAKQINIEEAKKLNVLSKNLATFLSDADRLLKQVDTLLANGKNCDIYVLMRKEASYLVSLNDELINTIKGKTYQRYEFQPNNDIFKAGVLPLGKLSSRKECVSLKSEKTVSNPSTDESSKSKQIQPGTRVYTDWGNGTVELYDSSSRTWKVNCEYGRTDYYSTDELVILDEKR